MKNLHFPNKVFFLASIVLLFGLANSCIKQEDLAICKFSAAEAYSLVWSDEFEGSEIDTTKWTFEIGDGCLPDDPGRCGWGNNELQYYTDRKANAQVKDGSLIIRALKENPVFMGSFGYTSARLITKEKGDWLYGRIDVRAKLPIGQGLWPAIWMLSTDDEYGGWPRSGEIDIMENVGHRPNIISSTLHFGHDFWRYIGHEDTIKTGPTYADEFHIFSVRWKENCIQFFVDDRKVGDPFTPSTTLPTTWPFDKRFHLLLNVAVGGNLPGNPDASTNFPQLMEVDYVRVYQEN